MRTVSVALGLVLLGTPALAQDRRLANLDLPREVERHINRLIEDSTTRKITGPTRIEAGETIEANVVAFDGPLTLAGRIEGELVVVGGNVEFLPGSSVAGDVTVVGGEVLGLELAAMGTFTSYDEGFQLFGRGERILAVNNGRRRQYYRRPEERSWGYSNLTVRIGTNYNRVEGLPVMFGPVIQTGGSSPTRVEALGIVRTGAGDLFESENMGFQLRAEQFLGTRAVRVGGTFRSVVEPIESWYVTNLEASLATFVLHEDQRDYFEREGWGAYLRLSPRSVPFDATVGYWDETHAARAARDPWTLFGDGAWRLQPLVAEGNTRSVSGRVQIDARNNDKVPTSGIFISAQAAHGLGGTLTLPSRINLIADSTAPILLDPLALNNRFNSGLIDLRLYRRVGGNGTLALRGAAGGSLDGKALPPQYQHALGGAGTLPGYRLFRGDCGARNLIVSRDLENGGSYYPAYGCDRFALGSIEFRGGLDFDFDGDFDFWDDHHDRDWHVDASPNWMLFFNAGRGWAVADSRERGLRDTEILYDAGAGLMLGDFGVFAAVPLTGDDRTVNVFVRLGARF